MVTGLEVAGLVAAIVSAFSGASSLAEKIRERRAQERKGKPQKKLEEARNDVDDEYQFNHRRLGHRFAVGDGMPLNQLTTYMK